MAENNKIEEKKEKSKVIMAIENKKEKEKGKPKEVMAAEDKKERKKQKSKGIMARENKREEEKQKSKGLMAIEKNKNEKEKDKQNGLMAKENKNKKEREKSKEIMAADKNKKEKETEIPKNEKLNNKRKHREVFVYGNYKSYYGYRIDPNAKEDPRLAVFNREWFEAKDCLDIGCNQGIVTIAIAKKFECKSIIGIDIDADLINSANWNLRKTVRQENANTLKNSDHSANNEYDLKKAISFRRENFVGTLEGPFEKYDTILCLSVSKWIHLNWGDEGLITLFVKIWRLLKPGGIFILEPQPWSSYKKNRLVSETTRANYEEICIRPDVFHEILLDKIGFRSGEIITDKLSGTVAGFDRPIIAFHK